LRYAHLAASAFLVFGAGTPRVRALQPVVNYQLQCMGCHLADGSGQAGRVPSIRRSLSTFSRFPAGRSFVVRVPGVAESPLSDGDLAALLNWLAGTMTDVPPGREFHAYTAEEVHALRSKPLTDVRGARARILRAASRARAEAH
jgi:hypothetical protein